MPPGPVAARPIHGPDASTNPAWAIQQPARCQPAVARTLIRAARETQRAHLPLGARLLCGLACWFVRSRSGVMLWSRPGRLLVGNELREVGERVSQVIGGKRWEPDSLSCGLRGCGPVVGQRDCGAGGAGGC
jgi:hypothetical protein